MFAIQCLFRRVRGGNEINITASFFFWHITSPRVTVPIKDETRELAERKGYTLLNQLTSDPVF